VKDVARFTVVWHWPRSHFVAPFLLSLFATGVCCFASGPTLGLFFGTFFVAAMIVPPLQQTGTKPAPIVLGTCAGTAIVWLASTAQPDVYLFDCLKSLVVLGAWGFALMGVGNALRAARCGPTLAAGGTVLLALAWLTWPVWLSGALETSRGQQIVDLLVPAHPLFAVNAVMKQFGAWDHYPALAYPRLTLLNQDVSYRQPGSIVPSVALHAAIGMALLIPQRGETKREDSPQSREER
jgi:hypothetical protein